MTELPPESPVLANAPIRVTVVDLDMPFMSIVMLLVKWALAAIPAAIVLAVLGAMLFGFIAAVTGTRL